MSGVRAIVKTLDTVQPKPISWLWRHRLARGKLNFLVGDPGLGKSFVTLDLAARVSTGTPWPDTPLDHREPASVLLFSAEDGDDDTIVPRLIAAEANLGQVRTIPAVEHVEDDDEPYLQLFNLVQHVPVLEQNLEENPDTALVIIDPVSAYCGNADTHKNSEVRGLLAPLADMANRFNVAVLCVSHLNKNAGAGNALYRTMGSLAFTAAARMVWAITKDKDDPTRRLMLPVKHNIAPEVTGLAYRIVPTDDGGDMAIVSWESGDVTLTADEALSATTHKGHDKTERTEAAAWLKDTLSQGPALSDDLRRWCKDAGYSWRTVWRAKKEAGVKARPTGSRDKWQWYLG